MKISDFKSIEGFRKLIGTSEDCDVLLSTNSKLPNKENTFLALKGDRFDAYNFIEDALSNGATCIITTYEKARELELQKLSDKYPKVSFYLVEDSLRFLQDSAKFRVLEWKKNGGIIFGLTGSNGKTTTKELLYSLAKSFLNDIVYCTQGNLNNHIGVPLTIFQLGDHHKFAIIEMGTNHFGEIETLCEIAQPDYGFITNIGHAHTEFLKDLKGVLKEKSSLYDWVVKNGRKFFLNMEDDMLATLNISEHVVPITKLNVHSFESEYIKESYNVWNVQAACFILENIFSVSLIHEFKKLKLPENKRAQWITVDNTRIYLDAYNANPTSMNLAIREFSKQVPGDKKVLYVIGDMNELGDETQFQHELIARLLNELGISNAFFVGRFAKFYDNVFRGASQTYDNLDNLKENWSSVLKSYDYIFLKASRSLQLEKLIDITM